MCFALRLIATDIPTAEPIPNLCDKSQGFKPFNSDCFLFVDQPMSWSSANAYCRQKGAYLATISDVFEQSFLYLLIHTRKAAWIGLNDLQVNTLYAFYPPTPRDWSDFVVEPRCCKLIYMYMAMCIRGRRSTNSY